MLQGMWSCVCFGTSTVLLNALKTKAKALTDKMGTSFSGVRVWYQRLSGTFAGSTVSTPRGSVTSPGIPRVASVPRLCSINEDQAVSEEQWKRHSGELDSSVGPLVMYPAQESFGSDGSFLSNATHGMGTTPLNAMLNAAPKQRKRMMRSRRGTATSTSTPDIRALEHVKGSMLPRPPPSP